MRMVRLTGAVVAAAMTTVIAATIAGCASVEPWQKGNLAKPSMTFGGNALDERYTQHIYTSKENASGGYSVGGGGCGCN